MISALSVERVTLPPKAHVEERVAEPLRGEISGIRPIEEPAPETGIEAAALRIPTPTGTAVLSASDIEALIAAENYVEICTSDGKQYLHRATLQGMGEALRTPSMIRVRRSAIINLDHLHARMPGGKLRLTSGRIVAVGRTYRADFEATLEISKVGSPHPRQYS
jgi:DNA-binding LytR/AlgR family response regulator